MSSIRTEPRVRYQEDLDPEFGDSVAAMPGGERLNHCIQCGTCSSTCPLSIYMDYTPRRIMAMTRAGFKDEVLRSNTIWLCASCYACTVECPKEIGITDVMYTLKRRAIQEGVSSRRFAIPVLAKTFFHSVRKTGRSNESRTVMRMFLKTNPLKLLSQIGLGWKLLFRGRMKLTPEKMTGEPEQLQKLLDAAPQTKITR